MPQTPQATPAPQSDDDFELADAARRGARRKALWWIFGGFALLFALMICGLIADEPPPDLSDLRVTFKHPSEEQNAYALLSKLSASLPPEPEENTSEERHFSHIFPADVKEQVAWDQGVVSSVLARYPAGLADQVRSTLDAPESEAPEIKSFSDSIPEIGRFRSLARVITWQAERAWHGGDHMAAFELNLLALKLGHRISQSRGPIITVLTGTMIEGIALAAIQRHADSQSISPEVLSHYLEQIGQYAIQPEDYHTAYKLETVVFANTARNLGGSDLAAFFDAKKTPMGSVAALPGLWQSNRTVRWHAEFIRGVISETDSGIPSHSFAAHVRLMEHIDGVGWPRRLQNISGRAMLAALVPSIGQVNTTCHRTRARLRLTEVYLALRLYHQENNMALPASLEELVPRFLPTLPLDPFDEKPLKYSRALSTIWSVDQKHLIITDADGEFPERGMPAFRLRFVRPPVPLPAFAEYEAQQNGDTGTIFGGPQGETAPSDVSPSK